MYFDLFLVWLVITSWLCLVVWDCIDFLILTLRITCIDPSFCCLVIRDHIVYDVNPLKFWKLVLWPSIWCFLGNVPCALENVCSAVVGRRVLQMSVRSSWLSLLCKSSGLLLIFHPVILTSTKYSVLKSAVIFTEACVLPSVLFAFVFWSYVPNYIYKCT